MSQRTRRNYAKAAEDDDDEEEEEATLTSEDFVNLDGKLEDKPYLKCIELTRYAPHHFQLDKWRPTFVLNNPWMKRIYRKDIYHDTDFPEPEPAAISFRQKRILNDHVKQLRQQDQIHTATKTRQKPPLDCLLECLGRPAIGVDIGKGEKKLREKDLVARRQSSKLGQPLCSLNSDNIAICARHKVQPEEVIVNIALEKMRSLSFEEEQRFQALLRDQEYMQELNSYVEKYLTGSDGIEGSAHVLSNEQQHSDNNPNSCE